MPNQIRNQTMYVSTGNPDTVNDATLYKPGELGSNYDGSRNGIGWQYKLVQLDSGATSGPTVGVVAINQLAYWKDKAAYLVTNDAKFAGAGPITAGVTNFPAGTTGAASAGNFVAGVFRGSVTAGNYCFILQRGQKVPVVGSATFATGEMVFGKSSSTAADVDRVGVGTAATYRQIGVALAPAVSSVVNIDLEVPELD